MTTFERIPSPSQMTSSGAMAMIGIAWLATIYGDRTFSNERDLARIYPTTVANETPAKSPSTISSNVMPV